VFFGNTPMGQGIVGRRCAVKVADTGGARLETVEWCVAEKGKGGSKTVV